jgi:hypothetical protein
MNTNCLFVAIHRHTGKKSGTMVIFSKKKPATQQSEDKISEIARFSQGLGLFGREANGVGLVRQRIRKLHHLQKRSKNTVKKKEKKKERLLKGQWKTKQS